MKRPLVVVVLLGGCGTEQLEQTSSAVVTDQLRLTAEQDFGVVQAGGSSRKHLYIFNDGAVPAPIEAEVVGESFRISAMDCHGNVVPPVGRCSIQIELAPSHEGSFVGELVVRSLLTDTAHTAHLYGAQGSKWRLVHVEREGLGRVTSGSGAIRSPMLRRTGGIDCGSRCGGYVDDKVKLTAMADGDSVFIGWSDLGCGTERTCVVPHGFDSRFLRATFAPRCTGACGTLSITLAGDGAGEVRVFQGESIVASCAESCTISAPLGELVIVASTPENLVSIDGDCSSSSDRCTVELTTSASVTATFARDLKDRWTFYGNPGEVFLRGVFDELGNLYALSTQRLVKLDRDGGYEWARPYSQEDTSSWMNEDPRHQTVFVGPDQAIYIATGVDSSAPRTIKLDGEGNEIWVRDGAVSAVAANGNILVSGRSFFGTSSLLSPDGTTIWTRPWITASGFDGAGNIFGPIRKETSRCADDECEYYDREIWLEANQYSPSGETVGTRRASGTIEFRDGWWEDPTAIVSQLVVTPTRVAGLVGAVPWFDPHQISFMVTNAATGAIDYETRISLGDSGNVFAAVAASGDEIGLAYTPTGYFGVVVHRIMPGSPTWTLERPSRAPGVYGFYFRNVVGGSNRDLAVLGVYEPFRFSTSATSRSVGFIQAYAP